VRNLSVIIAGIMLLSSCSPAPEMKPYRQTPEGLVVETSQFSFTIPGEWRQEGERPSKNVVYWGRSKDATSEKQLIISGELFQPGLTDEQRRESFDFLVSLRREVEAELDGGAVKVIAIPTRSSDGLLVGGHVGIHSQRGRMSFSRTVADSEKAFTFYLEMWGFSSKPDVTTLLPELDKVFQSATLK